MPGSLTVTYDGKYPTISWTPYIPFPTSYNIYWRPGPSGNWEQQNLEPILVEQWLDNRHVFSSDHRYYYRVTALVGPLEVAHVPETLWMPQASQTYMQNILNEIKRRSADIVLEKLVGELCTVYIRKGAGTPCDHQHAVGDGSRHEYPGKWCPICYNVGIVGGYAKVDDVMIRVRNPQSQVELRQEGIVMTEGRTCWLGNYPLMSTGDFFIRQNGERFTISNRRARETQGHITLQVCSISEVEPEHPLYSIQVATI